MGGRGGLREPRRWLSWGKRVGEGLGKYGISIPEERCQPAARRLVPDAVPPRKASREEARARTKTDTGGQVENTKVIEITLLKELGKIAPYLRNKERPSRVKRLRAEPEGAAVNRPKRLFTKNTGLC